MNVIFIELLNYACFVFEFVNNQLVLFTNTNYHHDHLEKLRTVCTNFVSLSRTYLNAMVGVL